MHQGLTDEDTSKNEAHFMLFAHNIRTAAALNSVTDFKLTLQFYVLTIKIMNELWQNTYTFHDFVICLNQ